jgi:hypothetical protein
MQTILSQKTDQQPTKEELLKRYSLDGLTRPQRNIFCCGWKYRFRVVVAGRRFGKTVLGITEALHEAQTNAKQLIWYIAPTYRMAKDLVWEDLKEAIPPEMIAYKNEAELSITLKGTKSKIVLKGADNPDSLRGKGLNFVIFDEAADITEETWFKVIYPALTDKQGSALFIGTPKGFNWFYDLFMFAAANDNWKAFSYTTEQGGNVSIEELEYAKQTLSEKQYAQEFLASFETLSNCVYSAFDRTKNVTKGVEDYDMELMIGMDFNVNPMSAVVGSRITDQLHIFDEIEIINGNTELMCEEIKARYPGRKVYIYPDPSGKSRKTSAPIGQTDHSILREYGFSVITPNKAPPVVDRINEVNALCQNAAGKRRLFISPECKTLIKCLDGLTYKENTSQPDKSLGLDHMTDGLGYLIHMEFPIEDMEVKTMKILGL